MRMKVLTALLCILALSASAFALSVPGFSDAQRKFEVKGQFIVQFSDDAQVAGVDKGFGMFRLGVSSVDRLLDAHQATEVRPLFPTKVGTKNTASRFYVISIDETQDDASFRQDMMADPNVVYIQNDIICMVDATPNDPSYGNQWFHYQASRKDIHSQEAWDVEVGSDDVIIAIIDSGVLYNHPDLRDNIWVNPAEDLDGDEVVWDSTDINGVDNDGNGYVDDFIGYDFIQSVGGEGWPGEDISGRDNDPKDFNGHGTHVAGIAAAVSNNNAGVAGVAGGWGGPYWDRGARIMCLRAGYSAPHPDFGWETGFLVMSAVAEAVQYAADNGADVVNYSAGSSWTASLQVAYNNLNNAGISFCASAGNEGSGIGDDYFDTAPGVIVVAWTTVGDGKAGDSNYGAWVDIAAPGSGIYATYSDHYNATYASLSGTSMSSPCVAGAVAIAKSVYPQYDKTVLDTMVVNNADPLVGEFYYDSGLLGSGRLNVWNAIQNTPKAEFTALNAIGSAPLTVDFADASPAATSWTWDFGDGAKAVNGDPNTQHIYNDAGVYSVSLTVDDANGTDVEMKKNLVYVSGDTIYSDIETMPGATSTAIPIRIKNTVPLEYLFMVIQWPVSGDVTLAFNDLDSTGTVSENFQRVQITNQLVYKMGIEFIPTAPNTTSMDPLMPGDHHLVDLYFTATGNGTAELTTTTFSGKSTEMTSIYGHEIEPAFETISITIGQRGDANGDGSINVGDAVHIINYVFKGGPAPVSDYNGDANADDNINVGDGVYLINFVFNGGPPPPQ